MEEKGLGVDELKDLVTSKSGLYGMSGISADMRALNASDDPRAKHAVDVFVSRVVRELGSLAAGIGGLAALVFTAGIGENDASLRARVCAELGWLGVTLDDAANAARGAGLGGREPRGGQAVLPRTTGHHRALQAPQ